MTLLAGVLTVSDMGSRGEREDTAGPAVAAILEGAGFEVTRRAIVADDQVQIVEHLDSWASDGVSLILTAGGTGLSPRDRTPEATRLVVEYEVPGIPEAMRAAFVSRLPAAMLSRGIAGVRGQTLIVNLPGSEKGATENLQVVLPALQHACELLRNETSEVARTHQGIQGQTQGQL
jgi:molybdopterin adenylyltransferase